VAVLVTAEIPGGDAAQAEGWAARAADALRASPGFVAQVDHPADGGWRVVSIWDSADDFQRYFDRVVRPNLPPGAPVGNQTIVEATHVVTPEPAR
jgi:hypothetical protein